MFGRIPPKPDESIKFRTPHVMEGETVSWRNALILEYSVMYWFHAACCSLASLTPVEKSSLRMVWPKMYSPPFFMELQKEMSRVWRRGLLIRRIIFGLQNLICSGLSLRRYFRT